MTSETSNAVTDVSQAFPRWNANNVPDLTEGIMKKVDDVVCYSQEVEEVKKNVKTGKTIKIFLVNVDIDGVTKPAKFGSESMETCAKKYGKNPQNWHGKKVVAKHSSVGVTTYIIWTPKASLDKA